MKLMSTTLINKKCFLKIIVIDIILLLLFWYNDPLCEPCLVNNCPPCLSKEQYLILYTGFFLNFLLIFLCLYKRKKK
jgi:hypothetical protein